MFILREKKIFIFFKISIIIISFINLISGKRLSFNKIEIIAKLRIIQKQNKAKSSKSKVTKNKSIQKFQKLNQFKSFKIIRIQNFILKLKFFIINIS